MIIPSALINILPPATGAATPGSAALTGMAVPPAIIRKVPTTAKAPATTVLLLVQVLEPFVSSFFSVYQFTENFEAIDNVSIYNKIAPILASKQIIVKHFK